MVSQCTGSAHDVISARNGQYVRSRFRNVVNAKPDRMFCSQTHAFIGWNSGAETGVGMSAMCLACSRSDISSRSTQWVPSSSLTATTD
ncbi:Uncharacterised protein [Mycobacteroides abscessus subsp. massiliense]|nr:Uncharacterised protein [Mycobacteroides abscessus subsp. massiliense]